MTLVHDDAEFGDLLSIVAQKRRLSVALVEKDYWVTHALWNLQRLGLALWFKGGTSLSKGFGLIERFSEDLDLKIERGRLLALPEVMTWKGGRTRHRSAREQYFRRLAEHVRIGGAERPPELVPASEAWESVQIRLDYPATHARTLPAAMSPFVLLEVGAARTTPFVECDLSSFVHDELVSQGKLRAFLDNRPRAVRCVHPLVTLIEKLDALQRRARDDSQPPAKFVRHYEDAARIAQAAARLPPLIDHEDALSLAQQMLASKDIDLLPASGHPAFVPSADERTEAIRRALREIGLMYWGPRLSLEQSCADVRAWIARNLEREA